MTSPLSWVYVLQVVLLILVISSALAGLLLLYQRRRPQVFHVIEYEKQRTFEEVRAEIEKREKVKPKWQLTEAAKERGFRDE
jgi:hypothetical protein